MALKELKQMINSNIFYVQKVYQRYDFIGLLFYSKQLSICIKRSYLTEVLSQYTQWVVIVDLFFNETRTRGSI